MDVINLCDGICIISILSYVISLIFIILTYIATHMKHTIIGAIFALIAMFFSQVSSITIKIGIFLALARVVLTFI